MNGKSNGVVEGQAKSGVSLLRVENRLRALQTCFTNLFTALTTIKKVLLYLVDDREKRCSRT